MRGVPTPRQSELPEGWREAAELDEWVDSRAPSWRRGLVLRVAAVAVVVIAVVGVLVWVAAGHYARGVEALRGRRLFHGRWASSTPPSVLVFPYRDAQALEEQARRALQAEFAASQAEQDQTAAVVAGLERAAARLRAATRPASWPRSRPSPRTTCVRPLAAGAPAAEVAGELRREPDRRGGGGYPGRAVDTRGALRRGPSGARARQ